MEQQRAKRKKIVKKAYAKINLFLEIYKKREDGYHNIRTIFSEISLNDEIIFTLTKNPEIKFLSFPEIVNLENNIIYKIAVFIKDKYGVQRGVEIILKKQIPHQAGLGGGSSDAASTIMALNELWRLNLSLKEMEGIAQKFGSDISFFLFGGTAIGKGRGEILEPLPKDILIDNIVLIKPALGISTKEAYSLIVPREKASEKWDVFLSTTNVEYTMNDFEEVILKKYPEIQEIFNMIIANGAKPLLSGSGSTVIAFCKSRDTAKKINNYFANRNYWTYITKTMRRQK